MKKINFLIFAITILLLQSCLKGRDMVLDPGSVPSVVEFGNSTTLASATDSFRLYVMNFEITPSGTFNVVLNYTGASTAPKDINVTMAIDNALLDSFNSVKKVNHKLLPSSLYTMPTSGVIKSGTRSVSLPVVIKVDQISLTDTYVIPLRITDASGVTISKNFGRVMFRVVPMNKWDGRYTITGLAPMTDLVNANLAGQYPLTNMPLITQGASTVALYDGRYATNNFAHPILNGTAQTSYGNFSPVFAFSGENITSVVNYFGQGTNTSLRGARLESSFVNKVVYYNDGTVNYFEVKYYMTEGAANAVRTTFTERFTRTGPR